MIGAIIQVLDAVAAGRLSAPARNGLCELIPVESGTAPAKYVGGDSWQIISVDSGGDWSYWRLTDRIREARDERMASCDTIITATHSLRLVTLISREVCDSAIDTARAAASDMRKASRTVRDATGAMTAEIAVSGIDADSARVYAAEFKGVGGAIPAGKMLVAIDMVVAITGREECFGDCGNPIDPTCAVIATASDANVAECLGGRLDEICDNAPCPTPCEVIEELDASEIVACVPSADRPALTVASIGTPEATAEVIVVGMDQAGKTDAVKAIICAPCLVDVPIRVDTVLVETLEDLDPCEAQTININITYS